MTRIQRFALMAGWLFVLILGSNQALHTPYYTPVTLGLGIVIAVILGAVTGDWRPLVRRKKPPAQPGRGMP